MKNRCGRPLWFLVSAGGHNQVSYSSITTQTNQELLSKERKSNQPRRYFGRKVVFAWTSTPSRVVSSTATVTGWGDLDTEPQGLSEIFSQTRGGLLLPGKKFAPQFAQLISHLLANVLSTSPSVAHMGASLCRQVQADPSENHLRNNNFQAKSLFWWSCKLDLSSKNLFYYSSKSGETQTHFSICAFITASQTLALIKK